MLFDRFLFETPGVDLAATPRWETPGGGVVSSALFATVDGRTVVELPPSETYILRTDVTPLTVHPQTGEFGARTQRTLQQRAEMGIRFGATVSGDFAVVVRARGANNWIAASCSATVLGPTQLSLVECIDGAATTLIAVPWRGAKTLGQSASIRLEVVKNRARIWYEVGDDGVRDRPPDAGATLAGEYLDFEMPGTWGMRLDGNTGSDGYVTFFNAGLMPSAVMSPPMLRPAAAAGYRWLPVTLEYTGQAAAFHEIEWEVMPAEAADFAEGYRAITKGDADVLGPANPYVVMVREGFAYKARARARLSAGAAGWSPWTEWADVGPLGAAPAGTTWANKSWQDLDWPVEALGDGTELAPLEADDTFPADINPDFVFEGEDEARPIIVSATTGDERVASQDVRPRRKFTLTFDNRVTQRDTSDYQRVLDFFEHVQGKSKPFNWTHPATGERFVLRFNQDDYEAVYEDHSAADQWEVTEDDGNPSSPIVSVALEAVESPITAATFTVTLEIDPELV